MFKCPYCQNTNKRYIGIRNGKEYCRKCIDFKSSIIVTDPVPALDAEHRLEYSLTPEQEQISKKIIYAYEHHINTLVKAVCGAGKTELVYGVVYTALKRGDKVAFAVPRKNVVIDLLPRFQEAFPNIEITSLYGGHTDKVDGNLIILTTHQLYRYDKFFDLLILDEADAFPFYQNSTLYSFLKRSCKGSMVILSATAPREIENEFKIKKQQILTLNVRFHHQPIPVPKVIRGCFIKQFVTLVKLLRKYKQEKKGCFVFVPTIDDGKKLFKALKIFCKNGKFVCSKTKHNEMVIERFGKHEFNYLVTTSILERGVTFDNLQVIVFKSDSPVFNESMLIQISGRVGRKAKHPNGDVYFLAKENTSEMRKAIYGITNSNKDLQNVLQRY